MLTRKKGNYVIQFVVWDLGDTLIRIRSSAWVEAASRIQEELKVPVSHIDVHKAVRQEWLVRNDPVSLNEIRNIDTEEKEVDFFIKFYSNVCKCFNLERPSKTLIEFLVRMQIDPQSYELLPGVVETLEALREMQIPQALLSNGFRSAFLHLKHFDLEKYFRLIMVSFEEKLVKPDKEIYQELLKRTQVDLPGTVLFVDDRLRFVEGAEQAGMQSIWLNHNNAENCIWENSIFEVNQILKKLKEVRRTNEKINNISSLKKRVGRLVREKTQKWEPVKIF
jgi:putative hydrolase of the HAD superfamily